MVVLVFFYLISLPFLQMEKRRCGLTSFSLFEGGGAALSNISRNYKFRIIIISFFSKSKNSIYKLLSALFLIFINNANNIL